MCATEDVTINELNKFKRQVLLRDNYTCQCCKVGIPAGSFKNCSELQVHHKNSQEKFPSQRIDVNNGVTLCINCHSDFHVWAEHIDYVTEENFKSWLKLTKTRSSYYYVRKRIRIKAEHCCQCCKGTWSQNKKLRIVHLNSWQWKDDSSSYTMSFLDRLTTYRKSLVLCTTCSDDFPNWYLDFPPTGSELSKFLDSGNPKRIKFRNLIKLLITLGFVLGFIVLYDVAKNGDSSLVFTILTHLGLSG